MAGYSSNTVCVTVLKEKQKEERLETDAEGKQRDKKRLAYLFFRPLGDDS